MIKVILKRNREESLLRFHPWVFSGAIAEIQGNPAEGDLVAVHACDGSLLAYGHYQIGSIAVRVLSFDDSALRPDFWETMLARALVSSPRLLLLDEPDTYLDSASEKRLFELLGEVARDCAIVLVTHDAHTIRRYCNRVVTLGRSCE